MNAFSIANFMQGKASAHLQTNFAWAIHFYLLFANSISYLCSLRVPSSGCCRKYLWRSNWSMPL